MLACSIFRYDRKIRIKFWAQSLTVQSAESQVLDGAMVPLHEFRAFEYALDIHLLVEVCD